LWGVLCYLGGAKLKRLTTLTYRGDDSRSKYNENENFFRHKKSPGSFSTGFSTGIMKIVFAGSSICWGDELKNPEEERYSRLVCNKLQAEEINVSRCGYSNDLLLHKFLKYSTTCGKPDVAVIQWTVLSRWQMWDNTQNDWEVLYVNTKYSTKHKLQWNAVRYYRHVYTDQHGIENYWKNVYLAEQYCKDNDIKLIMMNMIYKEPTVDYVSPYQSLCKSKNILSIKGDIVPRPKYKSAEWYEYYEEGEHPTSKGHQIIADYLIRLL